MRAIRTIALAAAVAVTIGVPAQAFAASSPKKMVVSAASGDLPADAQAAYVEMKATFGLVPTFMKMYPKEGIAGAWDEMKAVQMNPKSAIPGKYKELIGLAVSAQIPCHYCTYFHSEAAKLGGATARELSEAVATASSVRKWSAMLYGSQYDLDLLRKETEKLFDHLRDEQQAAAKAKEKGEPMPQKKPIAVTDASSARASMEQAFGFVPSFMNGMPDSALVAWWKTMTTYEMNPATAIPAKYKNLISVAVGSQVPCQYCTHFDTEAAKFEGATQQEIQEAYLVAATVRHWSTVLNGLQIDMKSFRAEVDQIMHSLRVKATPIQMGGASKPPVQAHAR